MRKFYFVLCAFLFTAGPVFASRSYKISSSEQARDFFYQNNKGDFYISETSIHRAVDNVFYRTDSNGNVYYIVINEMGEYSIMKIDVSSGKKELFAPIDHEKWQIVHFDISGDGQFIFMELHEGKTIWIPKIICIDTKKPGSYTTVINFYGKQYWRRSSLVYSDASECLYFYTYCQGLEVHNQEVVYDTGFYTCPKKDGKFSEENTVYYLQLPNTSIKEARKAYINSKQSDYKGFLEWIYHFSDKGEKTFCYLTDDGRMLTEEEALKYLIQNNLFEDSRKFLKQCVHKVQNKKILEDSAFQPAENLPEVLPENAANAFANCFFYKSADGIFFFSIHEFSYKDEDGTEHWKSDYIIPYWIEKADGTAPNEEKRFFDELRINSVEIERTQTIFVYDGALVFKGHQKEFNSGDLKQIEENSRWYVFKGSNLNDFAQKDDALRFLKALNKKAFLDIKKSDNDFDFAQFVYENLGAIIIILVLLFVCLAELVLLIYSFSKKFSQHLSIKDKQFIFNIQEAERSKLSHDIHDSIVQNIRAIRLDAEMLQVAPESEAKKQHVVDEMTNAITILRNICYNFKPAELSVETDNTELISIIDTLCQQFISRTKIPCQIQIQKDFAPPKIDVEKSTNIVRAVQEALSNIEKHSYATKVQILIKTEGSTEEHNLQLIIFIIDDGIGCDVNKLGKDKMNFGIRNMKERIAASGGEIEFFSTPNEGLSIQMRIHC